MKCEVCSAGLQDDSLICPRCSFDNSRNYENYPTTSPVDPATPNIDSLRERWYTQLAEEKARKAAAEQAATEKAAAEETARITTEKAAAEKAAAEKAAAITTLESAEVPAETTEAVPAKKKGKKKGVLIGILCVCLAIIVVGSALFVAGSALFIDGSSMHTTDGRESRSNTQNTSNAQTAKDESADWRLNGKVLTISSNAATENLESADDAPWADNVDEICTVVIEDGVTMIGPCAFANCRELTKVTIPASVTYVAKSAFQSCVQLEDVYYAGSKSEWDEISIGDLNGALKVAAIHYNSTGE